jgi:hypothetical protein
MIFNEGGFLFMAGYFQLNPEVIRRLQQHNDPIPLPRIMPPPKNPDGLPGGSIGFPVLPYKDALPPVTSPQAGFDAGMQRSLPLPDLSRFLPPPASQQAGIPLRGAGGFAAMNPEVATPPQQTGFAAMAPESDREGYFARSARLAPPSESIEAQDAPLNLSRIGQRDFVRPVIDEGLRSTDLATRRLALRDAGIPLEVQDMLKPKERPQLRDHSTDEKRGFWGNVKHRLEHVGKGALLGGATGGLGGMLAGAVAGGVNPEFADRLENNLVIQPRWKAENEYDQKQADETLNRAGKYAQMSGIDPFTGQPTAQASSRDRNYQLGVEKFLETQDKNDASTAATNKRLNQTDQRIALQEKQNLHREKQGRINTILRFAKIPGRKFDADTKAELEDELGVSLPAEFNPSQHTIKVDADGNYQVVSMDKGTGKASTSPVIGANNKPLKAPDRATSVPQYVVEGNARVELEKELGIKDSNALIDNPAFAEAVRRETEADQQASASRGLAPSSQAAIERRVEKRIKRQIRAGDAITPDMVKKKAAEIYGRETKGGAKSGSGAVQKAPAQRSYLTPAEYQKMTENKTPAQKAAIDDRLRQRKIGIREH